VDRVPLVNAMNRLWPAGFGRKCETIALFSAMLRYYRCQVY